MKKTRQTFHLTYGGIKDFYLTKIILKFYEFRLNVPVDVRPYRKTFVPLSNNISSYKNII